MRRPRRGQGTVESLMSRYGGAIVLGVVGIAIWELGARGGLISPFILPAPSAIVRALVDNLASGVYVHHLVATVSAAVAGFAISAVLAVAVAGVLVSIPLLRRAVFPYVVAFQTLPKVAIAPIVVLWLGFGQVAKLFIVVFVCFFPILINALEGLEIRDRDKLELFQAAGANRWQLFVELRVPAALPSIFTGLHIGAVFALLGAVVAEFVGTREGLGYMLLLEKSQFNVPGVFALLVIMMVIGLVLSGLMQFLESRINWSRGLDARAAR
jgi:NitT/TauT family transport system permease protein